MSQKLSLQAVTEQASKGLEVGRRYSVVLFLVFVAALYGFIAFRINTLSTAEPSQDAVNGQVKAAQVPRIDPKVVEQLESLRDNSVSVQTLFNDARNSPFDE